MADKKVKGSVAATPDQDVVVKMQSFWDAYNQQLIYGALGVIVLVVGFFVYKSYIHDPKEEKANEAIFPAEALYAEAIQMNYPVDTVNVLLKGGDGIVG